MKTLRFNEFIVNNKDGIANDINSFFHKVYEISEQQVKPDIGYFGFPYSVLEGYVEKEFELNWRGFKLPQMIVENGKKIGLQKSIDAFISIHEFSMGFELRERELVGTDKCFVLMPNLSIDQITNLDTHKIVDEFLETWVSESETVYVFSHFGRDIKYELYDRWFFNSKAIAFKAREE
jgi:hypothetical protein